MKMMFTVVLPSLKLHHFVGSLLVQYSVAALSTPNHVSLLQGILRATVTADIRYICSAV